MIALVTGSTGFIGSHLCQALCGLDVQVRAFHRANSDTQLIDNLPVKHVIGDLTHPETLLPAMEKVDVVFHTAAVLNSREGKSKLYAVNVAGTRAVLDAALQKVSAGWYIPVLWLPWEYLKKVKRQERNPFY